MSIGASVQAAIAMNPEVAVLRKLAIEGGMRPLRHAAAQKVASGLTTVDEVLSLTPDPRDH
jgi:general secretion pathway protein E